MVENTFEGWNKIIKDTPLNSREPLWDQAIHYLVSEGAIEPMMYDTLTQGQIQQSILDGHYEEGIVDLFQAFGRWLISAWGETRFYVCQFTDGNELWLAYLMAVWHDLEWDGDSWVAIVKGPGDVSAT